MRNDSYEEQSAGRTGFTVGLLQVFRKQQSVWFVGLNHGQLHAITMRCVCTVIVKM